MFAEDRHARQKGCQKPERVVQADFLGQEANGGWSCQHARVSRSREGGNGQSLWHCVLRTREPEVLSRLIFGMLTRAGMLIAASPQPRKTRNAVATALHELIQAFAG